jgi:hypothetical protein
MFEREGEESMSLRKHCLDQVKNGIFSDPNPTAFQLVQQRSCGSKTEML